MSKDGPVCEERPVEYRDYAQRQLAYYIVQGGIYEPLLVILFEIFKNQDDKYHKILERLNTACYWKDFCSLVSCQETSPINWLHEEADEVVLCIMSCIWPEARGFVDNVVERVRNNDRLYQHFKRLIEEPRNDKNKFNKSLSDCDVQEINSIMKRKNDFVEQLNKCLDETQEKLYELMREKNEWKRNERHAKKERASECE